MNYLLCLPILKVVFNKGLTCIYIFFILGAFVMARAFDTHGDRNVGRKMAAFLKSLRGRYV